MSSQKLEDQLKELENIVEADLSNGKHIQKKLLKKLKTNGTCSGNLCDELKKLSMVK